MICQVSQGPEAGQEWRSLDESEKKVAEKFTKEAVRQYCFNALLTVGNKPYKTGGDDIHIPEAQEAREIGLHFVPFF